MTDESPADEADELDDRLDVLLDEYDPADTVRVVADVPRAVRDAAKRKTDYGGISDAIRTALRATILGEGEPELTLLQIELDRRREKRQHHLENAEHERTKARALEPEIARLEERVTSYRSSAEKYEGHLESIEGRVIDGQHVWESHPSIERAASIGTKSPAAVLADLQERNPEVPERAFVKAAQADRPWEGVNAESRLQSARAERDEATDSESDDAASDRR